jgi:hypothetical protein
MLVFSIPTFGNNVNRLSSSVVRFRRLARELLVHDKDQFFSLAFTDNTHDTETANRKTRAAVA